MGKDERKKTKVASAARAGELFAATSAQPAGAGFGFGGFMGSQSMPALRSSGDASNSVSPSDGPALTHLDSELSLHMRRLSKRDATTKVKALQALAVLTRKISAKELELLLPPWTHVYQRLTMDNSRGVREEAATVMGIIAGGVGRGLALFLKQVIGPWFMAEHDLQPEVARSASAALANVFPGRKLQDALTFCRGQVLEYLLENLKVAPEVLGDPQRETQEGIQERHQRVTASSLLAMAAMVDLPLGDNDAVPDDLQDSLVVLISQPGFFKKFLGSKVAVVRRSSYSLISKISRRQPGVLEGRVTEAAPSILGAFGDKDPGTHSEMWGMILAYTKAFPAAWRTVDVRKSILPKLFALLRNGCYGSATVSYPAVYPLLTLLPKDLISPDPHDVQQLLDAILVGWADFAAGTAAGAVDASQAAAACFEECWQFVIRQLKRSPDTAGKAAISQLASSPLCSRLLTLALSDAADISQAATSLLAKSVLAAGTDDARADDIQPLLLETIGAAVVQSVKDAGEPDPEAAPRPLAQHLPLRVQEIVEALAAGCQDQDAVSVNLAQPLISVLMQGPGWADSGAAELLASLINRFGHATSNGSPGAPASLEATRQAFGDVPRDSPVADAHADVLIACMLQSDDRAQALATTLAETLHQAKDLGASLQRAQLLLTRIAGNNQLPAVRTAEPAAASQNQAQGLSLWQSPELDNLAEEIVTEPYFWGGSTTAGQVMGCLIAGNSQSSFLSSTACRSLLQTLHQQLVENQPRQEALPPGSSPECNQTHSVVYACLGACLFARHLWKSPPDIVSQPNGRPESAETQDLVLHLTAHIYKLAHENEQAQVDAAAVWDLGEPVSILRPELSEAVCANLDRRLIAILAEELRQHLEEDREDLEWTQGLADSAVELCQVLEPRGDSLDTADPLDELLLSVPSVWPKYISSPLPQRLRANIAGNRLEGREPAIHAAAAMNRLVSTVCSKLGYQKAFISSSNYVRDWLASELLSAAAAGEVSVLPEALETCLIAQHEGAAAPGWQLSDDRQPAVLLCKVLQRLWGVLPEGSALLSARADALHSLLEAVSLRLAHSAEHSIWAQTMEQLMRQWTSDLGSSKLQVSLIRPFSLLARHIRELADDTAIQESALIAFSTENLRMATSEPPMWQALTQGPLQAAGVLDRLRTVASCFPVSTAASQPPLAATSTEKSVLATLAAQQLAGERSAAASQAAQQRAQQSANGGLGSEELNPEHRWMEFESIHARLLSAAALYSWQQLVPEQQESLVKRVSKGVQSATVKLEEAAEALSEAAVKVAARVNPGGDAISPLAAVGVLRRLQRHISDRANTKFQEASEAVEEALTDEDMVACLSAHPRAWLQACAVVLPKALPAEPGSKVPEAQEHLMSDALRCMFAVGIVSAIAEADGESGMLLLDHWAADLAPLLEAVAASCKATMPWEKLTGEACSAVDFWAQETGVDCITASLGALCGLHGFHDLQAAALCIILRQDKLFRLAAELDDDEEEELAERQVAAESGDDDAAILVAAGLRPELAIALSPHRLTEDDYEEDSWEGPQSELLAWAVLLAYLLGMPPENRERARISQAVHRTHSLVPSFLSRLVALLPLDSTKGSPSPQTPRMQPSAAAAAAAEARAGGRSPDAISWNLGQALLAARSFSAQELAANLYRAALRALPASARSWFQSLRDKKLASAVEAYTVARESRQIIANELAGVSGRAAHGEMTDAGSIQFSIRARLATREAVAVVSLEDSAVLELSIQLPPSWPLQDAHVDCRKGMGVAENRLRKWMLSITAMLRSQNGALTDAIDLWQRNCARQFAGVEECLICYNVILAGTGQLPKLACKTCSKRYHGACLYKWFRSSSKASCPHCQSSWL